MTPRYSIRAFDAAGEIVASTATGSLKMARRMVKDFSARYDRVELWEYKGMLEGVALYERVTL